MNEIAKIKKTKEGYILEEAWKEMVVLRKLSSPTLIAIQDNNVDAKQACPICGEIERHAPFGPWPFVASNLNPICGDCIEKYLPDLLPDLRKQRMKWHKENSPEMDFPDRFSEK